VYVCHFGKTKIYAKIYEKPHGKSVWEIYPKKRSSQRGEPSGNQDLEMVKSNLISILVLNVFREISIVTKKNLMDGLG
jgi:hypothetical protein